MPLRDLLLTLLAVFIWGSAFAVLRIGVQEMSPLMLTAARFLFSALPAIFLLPRPGARLTAMVGYGLALGVGMFGSLTTAIHLGLPVGLSSIVAQMQVLFTMLIAFFVSGERPTRMQLLGALVSASGMVVLAMEHAASAPLGPFLLVVFGAFCWGAANIIGKYARPANMPSFVAWASLAAPLPLVALAQVLDAPGAVAASFQIPSLKLALCIAFIGFIATNLAFTLWGSLLSRHPVSMVAPFALLIPIIGMASGALLFGEKLTPLLLAGSAVVLVGLALNVFGDALAAKFRA